MLFEKVNFSNFSVDPDVLLRKLRGYSGTYWPLSWYIVSLEDGRQSDVRKWLNENAQYQWDIAEQYEIDTLLVGFEDLTDSMMFKIGFTPPSTEGFI